jgi:arginyl-tRNA synthetase
LGKAIWFLSYLITGLLAVGFDVYGSDQELEKDPIKHLYEVYVKINVN